MTKKQTIELLEKQMPSFYSLDQVIGIIKDIEVGSVIDTEDLYLEIKAMIKDNIEEMNSEDAVDFSSAEFSLSYNEISLEDVNIDFNEVGSKACYGLEDLIEKFISLYKEEEPDEVGEAQV